MGNLSTSYMTIPTQQIPLHALSQNLSLPASKWHIQYIQQSAIHLHCSYFSSCNYLLPNSMLGSCCLTCWSSENLCRDSSNTLLNLPVWNLNTLTCSMKYSNELTNTRFISIYLTLTTFKLDVTFESLHPQQWLFLWISNNIKLYAIYAKGYKELQVQLEQLVQWQCYRPDDWGTGIWFHTWGRNFCQKVSRQALKPIYPPTKSIMRNLPSGKKWPGRDVDHSPTCSAKVKKECSYTSATLYSLNLWCLCEHKENLLSLL